IVVDVISISVIEEAEELAGLGMERGDAAAAEHADEKIAGELTETRGSERHAPWGVHRGDAAHAAEQNTGGAEQIDEAMLHSADVVAGVRVLQRIRHRDHAAADVLHVERHVSRGDEIVLERVSPADALEVAIVH